MIHDEIHFYGKAKKKKKEKSSKGFLTTAESNVKQKGN